MKTISRYLRFIRPFAEVEAYFSKPATFREFLSDLYCDFDVEFGAVFVGVHVCVFGFGIKLAVTDPLDFSIRLEAPCSDICFEFGLRKDWKADELFSEADKRRDEFTKYVDSLSVGDTIDRVWFDSDYERKQRISKVRREFNRKFWNSSRDDDIDIGNSVFIVFREDGVYVEVRPENPQSFDEVLRGLSDGEIDTLNNAADKIFPKAKTVFAGSDVAPAVGDVVATVATAPAIVVEIPMAEMTVSDIGRAMRKHAAEHTDLNTRC
jgi:hypothetical protein